MSESAQNTSCDTSNGFELFFVDRRLVDYRLENRTCSGTGESKESITHAKWNDQGQPVFFSLVCKSCKENNEQTTATSNVWATMESLGRYLSQNVLKNP